MLEMRYLWDTPHTLSGTKLGRLLPSFRPTDLAEVMRAGIPPELRRQPAGGKRAA
jgi:hypothetical protein